MKEEEIADLLKGLRFRIRDDGEFRINDKVVKEIAHEIYIEEGEE